MSFENKLQENLEKLRDELRSESYTPLPVKRVYTSRSSGWGNKFRIDKLKRYIRGWINYFKIADMKALLKQTDEWMRRRIRMVYWKQWKRIRTRFKMLKQRYFKSTQVVLIWWNNQLAFYNRMRFILIYRKKYEYKCLLFIANYNNLSCYEGFWIKL